MRQIPLEEHTILFLTRELSKSSEIRQKLSHPEEPEEARQVNVL